MNSIFITGHSGFVGKNICSHLGVNFRISYYERNAKINIEEDIVIHLAGKAHDINNSSSSDLFYEVNTNLTIKLFDAFMSSNARTFIFFSSVKAVSDFPDEEITEETIPNPKSDYGKSKLLAEQYIIEKSKFSNKRVIILRPCIIHGPGNKGNLNELYKLFNTISFWPLASFINQRSFCSIDNLVYVVDKIVNDQNIDSGIYNVSDSGSISINDLIRLISKSKRKTIFFIYLPKNFIRFVAFALEKMGSKYNINKLNKLTKSYQVNNTKILNKLGTNLPVSLIDGLIISLESYKSIN